MSRPCVRNGLPSGPNSRTSALRDSRRRASSASENENRTQIGSVCVMVVNRLSEPAVTRAPCDFCDRPVMPEMGATTEVYDRFSSASRTAACAAATAASDRRAFETASSYSRCEIACCSASGLRRCASRRACSICATRWARFARACCKAISNGARSIWNIGAPAFTRSPSS